MNKAAIAKLVQVNDDGYKLNIDVKHKNLRVRGALVESITMYIAKDADDGDGDLAVNWDMTGLQNNEDARTAGMLLLRNVHSNDDVTQVMGDFYWQHAFDDELHELLQAAGFSAEAASDVCGSEWGMQDEGRASYDAYAIADEVRAALA